LKAAYDPLRRHFASNIGTHRCAIEPESAAAYRRRMADRPVEPADVFTYPLRLANYPDRVGKESARTVLHRRTSKGRAGNGFFS
jgi:hypothetical protein